MKKYIGLIFSVLLVAAPVFVSAQSVPTITLFGAKDPNPITGATLLVWRATDSTNVNASINFTCPSSSNIRFTTDKGNNPICEKGGLWVWNNSSEGSITVTPVGNTQPITIPFTLSFFDQNGQPIGENQTMNITFPVVVPQAPTLTFTATPSQVTVGNSSAVTWVVTDATSCVGDWWGPNGIDVTHTNAVTTGSIYKDTTYSISCNGPGGSVTNSITVKVVQPSTNINNSASITSFDTKGVNPTTGAITLSWRASDTTNAQLDVDCLGFSTSFTTNKGNKPSCEKGGIWTWNGQSSGDITVYPTSNDKFTVQFILSLVNTNGQTSYDQRKTLDIIFPARSSSAYTSLQPTAISQNSQLSPTSSNNQSLQSLLDQIKVLQSQLSRLQSSQSGTPAVSSSSENTPSDTGIAVSSCVDLGNNLTYRSRDALTDGDVSALQDFLHVKGYLSVEPSGFFGVLTLNAVKKFQSDNTISPTGFVGSITRAKIKELSCQQ